MRRYLKIVIAIAAVYASRPEMIDANIELYRFYFGIIPWGLTE